MLVGESLPEESMRILWICNILLPMIAEKLQMDSSVKEGWITGLLSKIIQNGKTNKITLAVAFPMNENLKNFHDVYIFNGMAVECFGFYEEPEQLEQYDSNMESRFEDIYRTFQPDVVHIWGTEYGHAYAAAKAFQKPERILLGIQGIISLCAKEYMAGLQEAEQKKKSIRDRLKKDGLLEQQKKFALRGERETRLLLYVGNATGRTEFDRKFIEQSEQKIQYYALNETMRPCFYSDRWDYATCQKHEIFFSQADYPLKGFHILLQAMPIILKEYPDATIAVAGTDIIHKDGVLGFLKVSAYGKYLKRLIVQNGLVGKVHFLGKRSAEEMKQAYLHCHSFVCASSLENSPNSVAEAMLLGTPVVAAKVGGIPSMIADGREGLLFEKENAEDLARKLLKMWQESDFPLSRRISQAAAARASLTHHPQKNYERLMEIYQTISEKK